MSEGENKTGTERVGSDIGPPETLKAAKTKVTGQKVGSMGRFVGRISIYYSSPSFPTGANGC